MSTAMKMVMDSISEMPDDKLLKVWSFSEFVKKEADVELYISEEEESELIHLLETEERIDGDTVFRELLGDDYETLLS